MVQKCVLVWCHTYKIICVLCVLHIKDKGEYSTHYEPKFKQETKEIYKQETKEIYKHIMQTKSRDPNAFLCFQ